MVKLIASILALAFSATLALAAPSRTVLEPQVTVPAPAGFNVTSIGVLGTGCPPGSIYYALNADKTAVTVTFSEFFAEAGPGIGARNNRKACQLTVGINLPGGFTFGIGNVDYRGYYQLDKGVTAAQQAIYYFQGQVIQATARSDLKGPIPGKNYLFRDSFDLASTVLAPCGKNTVLNINSELRVSNAGNTQGTGYIATDSIDASLSTTFNFNWMQCKQ